VEEEARKEGKTWGELRALARNRIRLRCFVAALRSGKERQDHTNEMNYNIFKTFIIQQLPYKSHLRCGTNGEMHTGIFGTGMDKI
jgi:hypothetical protein